MMMMILHLLGICRTSLGTYIISLSLQHCYEMGTSAIVPRDR